MPKKMLTENGFISREVKESAGGPEGRWVADIWRLGERNLNGRVYTEALARRLAAEGRATVCYDGHESAMLSGLEYGNAVAVASNPRVESGMLRVDVTFTDPAFEARLTALSGAGIPVGVSSVGLGDVDGSGTVVSETYELVRWMDFVACPAGQVYAHKESQEAEASPVAGPPAGGKAVSAETAERVADAFVRYIGVLK